MGQARSQLRRLAARCAYRRIAAALGDLKRARDQLLDSMARLDALIADGLNLLRRTGRKATLAARPEQRAPQWLTAEHLSETQGVLAARTGELHAVLNAGLAQTAATDPADDPELARLRRRLEASTPDRYGAAILSGGADRLAGEVGGRGPGPPTRRGCRAGRRPGALSGPRTPGGAAVPGRVTHRRPAYPHVGTQTAAVPDKDRTPPDEPGTETRSEYLPMAHELQVANRKRLQRVSAVILDRLGAVLDAEEQAKESQAKGTPITPPSAPAAGPQAPDPPDLGVLEAKRRRLERADELRVAVEQAMQQAVKELEATAARPADDEGLTGLIDQA